MDSQTPTLPQHPLGYLSERNKRKFTIRAGILSAVFFLSQFILPFLAMPFLMLFACKDFSNTTNFNADRSALWNNSIWLIKQNKSYKKGQEVNEISFLQKTNLTAEPNIEPVCELPYSDAWLLPTQDKLWVISSSGIAYYQDSNLTVLKTDESLGNISRPFLYRNCPSVIRYTPNGFFLMTYSGNNWTKLRKINFAESMGSYNIKRDLQAVEIGNKLHLFVRYDQSLYYGVEEPGKPAEKQQWHQLDNVRNGWVALNYQGKPTVCCLSYKNEEGWITFKEFSNGIWSDSFSQTIPFTDGISVHQTQTPGEFIFTLAAYPDKLRVLKFLDGRKIYEKKYGEHFPRSTLFFPGIIFVPHVLNYVMPLILAFILSSMMKKYRICNYNSGASTICFASLSRRVLSQLVDALIFIVPALILLAVTFFINRFDYVSPPKFWMLINVFFALFWFVACFILFAVGEGLWGITPGKWLFRLRVLGLDLRPCGFGRALLRNLLKFVDGFFNFMVGIIIVALSENWQRIGDMAARTIVVDISKKS
jgi:uncharacterized RDD family membrane protein YckC